MRVLVTGAEGFLGSNLCIWLRERKDVELLPFVRQSSAENLQGLVASADFIFHLAGVNRPKDVAEFSAGNVDLTIELCRAVKNSGRSIPIIHTSSIQANLDNPYGRSKLKAEQVLGRLHDETKNPVHIFRLPNIFGKWCRPNYNSVVATFCYNIARQLPIQINDPASMLTLVYVDDVVSVFLELMNKQCTTEIMFRSVEPLYRVRVGELADQILAFRNSRTTLISERVGTGFIRALYATYLTHLPEQDFIYELPKYGDSRGVFVEMLKTPDAGQFSYFTSLPGVTRGEHYHHSKTEKFLVAKGQARFRFRHLITGEFHEVFASGSKPAIVETIPGWTHDITNVGDGEMVVMLWANEVFDRSRPDTVAMRVVP